MGKRGYISTILDLGSKWRWKVSFNPGGKRPLQPLDRRQNKHPELVWKLWNSSSLYRQVTGYYMQIKQTFKL
jgi:hypothetical protein